MGRRALPPDNSGADIMKYTWLELPIPRPILFLALPFLALAPQAATPAYASYGTQGQFSISTEGGSLIERNIPLGTQLDISDADTSAGGAGNAAAAQYSASITGASLSASASAQNALHSGGPPPDYWIANASATTNFHDELRFTIPAGSYPSGVHAIARMHVEGSVASSGGAGALHSYGLSFGESVSVDTIWPAPPVSVDIDLTAELLAPGTTLSTPTMVTTEFFASIQVVTTAPGEVDQSSSSDIGVQVACIRVPPGVTWLSDSGMFGVSTCSAGVPGLADRAVATLALALAGTALWIARRRHPEVA
jgi:hypothetical protein